MKTHAITKKTQEKIDGHTHVSHISENLPVPVGLMLMSSNICYLTQCNSSFVLSYWSGEMAGSSASRIWITVQYILYILNTATIPCVEVLMETKFRGGHIRLPLQTIGFSPFGVYLLWSIWWNIFFVLFKKVLMIQRPLRSMDYRGNINI